MDMTTEEKLAMALERNAELEQENERAYGKTSIGSQHLHALEETMLEELGGTVEGMATGRINYLQRIRELRVREAEAARYRAALESIADRAIWEVAGFCRWCGCRQSGTDVHSEDCPVRKTRALHPEEEG